MRHLFTLLLVSCATAFVLLDSKTVEFKKELIGQTEVTEQYRYKPEFHPDRLGVWFNNQVSKFSK